jgi:hypothetical protein
MSDPRFFDLALKAIAQQASGAERAELDALLAREPELRAEFARLQGDARLAKAVLPLVGATQATAGEFPAYARGRLQSKVRETLGQPQPSAALEGNTQLHMIWRWRWLLGLATAAAVIIIVAIPVLRQTPAPVVQVAMLDTAGASRGSEAKEVAFLQQAWSNTVVNSFSSTENTQAWETNWPGGGKGPVVKVLYDRPAGELRVLGRWKGASFAKTFVVEQDFEAALSQAKAFIQQQTRR